MRGLTLLLAAALCVISGVQAQLTEPGGSCCGVSLMDSSDRIVIETTPLEILSPVTFLAFRAHLCCINRTYVQIWKRLFEAGSTERKYELVWQMPVKATIFMVTSVKYTIFEIPNGLQLDSPNGQKLYHLGFWSPGNDKHCIPYQFLSTRETRIYASFDRFMDLSLSIGMAVEIDELPFPRTFAVSVSFCQDRTCNDAPDTDQPFYGAAVAGSPGLPGPPGTPGKGFDILEMQEYFSCDVGELVNGDIKSIKDQNDEIKKQVDDMSNIILELTKGNIVTGTCKQGGFPGSYGLGSCYFFMHNPREKMTYGEAMFRCREDYGALLADIGGTSEEVFLKRSIITAVGFPEAEVETFFLGAMFSTKTNNWFWHDEFGRRRRGLDYANWSPDYEMSAILEQYLTCVVLEVDFNRDRSYWRTVNCQEKHYYICKTAKQCL